MKALAIDSAITRLTISVRNGDNTVTAVYDIGMKQSETIIPAVDEVLSKAGLTVKDLDCLALCSGPGSFTGLRLSYAALKAMEMVSGKPLYGIPTLDAYSYSYKTLPFTVLCAVDAKKDRFYAKAYEDIRTVIEDGDWSTEQIIEKLKSGGKDILICGPDAELLYERIKNSLHGRKIYTVPFNIMTTDSLFRIAEEKMKKNEPPLKDFDGPVYFRASEAEVVLEQKAVRL